MYAKDHPYNLQALAMTKLIRAQLKTAGIKAHVRKFYSCGHLHIGICTRTYEQKFTDAEQLQIGVIADSNGLVGVLGEPVSQGRFFGQDLRGILPNRT